MNEFAKKLHQLRKSQGLTQREMSKALNININTYASYERGIREAGFSVLAKTCKEFDVSADYMLGLTDSPKNHTDQQLAEENQYLRNQLKNIQSIIAKTKDI